MKKLISMVSALLLCLFLSTCAYAVKPPPPDYLGMMSRAAARGDVTAGREAEALRAALIDETGSNEPKVSFDELYLLSRFINCEAGSIWVSDELRMCVGEVVLNRVASPEYPDSIEEVIYQEGQYEKVGTEEFQNLTQPALACVDAAMRLLLGERDAGAPGGAPVKGSDRYGVRDFLRQTPRLYLFLRKPLSGAVCALRQ